MKDKVETPPLYALHACVIIGPFSILQIGKKTKLSPFNVSDTVQVTYFTKEEVISLFGQFSAATKKELERGIVEDIFDRTCGHPGLVCFCGKTEINNECQSCCLGYLCIGFVTFSPLLWL
jgi:hypothetical protein